MPDKPLTIEQILTRLAEEPSRIAALTVGLTPAQLRTAPTPGEWSANDVLAHLRSCADVWGNYIMTILAEDRPAIRAISPRTWIHSTGYSELEFRPSLRTFTTQRADLMSILQPLPLEAWSRAAIVTAVGRPIERTVLSFAERLARHERSHVQQIELIANKMSM